MPVKNMKNFACKEKKLELFTIYSLKEEALIVNAFMDIKALYVGLALKDMEDWGRVAIIVREK